MRKKLSKNGNASNQISQLIEVFSTYHPLSEGLENELRLRLKPKKLKKDTYLATQGEYCDHFYYLAEGILIATTNTVASRPFSLFLFLIICVV